MRIFSSSASAVSTEKLAHALASAKKLATPTARSANRSNNERPGRSAAIAKAAMRVAHRGHKVSLSATIDSKPNPAGNRLRIHYGWSAEMERDLVGWVGDLTPKA